MRCRYGDAIMAERRYRVLLYMLNVIKYRNQQLVQEGSTVFYVAMEGDRYNNEEVLPMWGSYHHLLYRLEIVETDWKDEVMPDARCFKYANLAWKG